jgi:ABC-type polysaccharide/polyol phosphate export permease
LGKGLIAVARLRELVQYRELVKNLVIRDLKVRYKNSVLGFLWSLLNPLMMMVIFTVVFTIMLPNNTIDRFPVFVLCALLPWNFFSSSVMTSMHSIVGNAHLIKKVYFPREVLPLSAVLANLVNFLLAMTVLFGMIFVFRTPLTVWALLLPVVVIIQLIFTLGLAFFLSTLNVFYRDTAAIMDVAMLAWFFLTPVFYPITILPHYRTIFGFALDIQRLAYILNPMASIIASYRVILYHGAPPAFDFLARTAVTSLALLSLGYLVFLRYSKIFAEQL